MIYISSSFPKSASTLLFLYTEALLAAGKQKSGQRLFRRFYKEGYIANIGIFNGLFLLLLSFFFGNIVVKTHGGYRYITRWLIGLGLARGFYIYRDPRDILLSALDHGVKARHQGIQSPADRSMVEYESVEQLYPMVAMFYNRYRQWKSNDRNEMLTYYELIAQPLEILGKHASFMELSIEEKELKRIVAHFAATKKETKNFNTDKLHRFEAEMDPGQLRNIEARIGYCIQGMGFELVTGGKQK